MRRLLRWRKNKGDADVAGFFDLGHFCEDKDPVRLVGAAATKREDKDLFRFEVSGHGTNHRLFADSHEERATWIS